MLNSIHVTNRWPTFLSIGKVLARNYRVPFDVKPMLRDLYNRRLEAGPEPERPRSVWSNWNYDSEIFAFSKRLKENFDDQILRQAFIDKSYLLSDQKEMERLQLTDISVNLKENTHLAEQGSEIASLYSRAYLRRNYPYLPEEFICSIEANLTSDQSMAYVGAHLGVKDLILSNTFPHSIQTIANVFRAVIGALSESQGQERAQLFVRDFILTQLVGADINQYFTIKQPITLLQKVLIKHGMNFPEPRLLKQSASNTVLSCYHVGIYCDKRLLAQSPGESIEIATEEAARESLKYLFGTSDSRQSLPFYETFSSEDMQSRNVSLAEYHSVQI